MSDIVYGVQLYTFRKQLKTPEQVEKVFKELSQLECKTVQISGMCELPAKRLREIADSNNISVCSTHSPFDRIINDLDALAREHLVMGCEIIGLGMMPIKYLTGAEGIKRFCEIANAICGKLKPYGLKFGYHNHFRELKTLGEGVILDILAKEIPDMQLILDTYWVKYAGKDPVEFINKYPGRLDLIHLKDYNKGMLFKHIADVGSGSLNWSEIIKAANNAGTKYAVVEHDNTKDPLLTVKNSLDFIRTIS